MGQLPQSCFLSSSAVAALGNSDLNVQDPSQRPRWCGRSWSLQTQLLGESQPCSLPWLSSASAQWARGSEVAWIGPVPLSVMEAFYLRVGVGWGLIVEPVMERTVYPLYSGACDCRSMAMSARLNLDRTLLPALPWAWLLLVCLFYNLFAGPLLSTLPYPKTLRLCWLVPNPFAEPMPTRHCTRNTGLCVGPSEMISWW